MKNTTIALLALLASPSIGYAAVTYIDASVTNTVGQASGLVDWNDGSDVTMTDGAAANDGLWRYRNGQGNGIWEATGGSGTTSEDAVEIVTTTTVPDGIYNVFVFYYAVNPTGDYPIRAGLSSNPNLNTIFDRVGTLGVAGGDALADLTFVVAPATNTRTLLFGNVGQTTVTGGSLNVFIDDFPASDTASSNDRTWYAGVGYEAVPEPSSTALLGLGGLALILRRRK